MSKPSTRRFITAAPVLLFAALANAQAAPGPIVLSGDATPAGGTYSAFFANTFNAPVLNASARGAFVANVNGGSANSGLFTGTRGSIQSVALQGAPAPGGSSYSGFVSDFINGAGQVAFRASLASGNSGIYVGTPGSVQVAAVTGAASPAGGTYSGLSDPVFAGNGQVVFGASLQGVASSSGIFGGTPGSIQTFAVQGAPAPGLGPNTFYGNMGAPVENNAGVVAFNANLSTGGNAIFGGTPGFVSTLVRTNTFAPGGGTFTGLANPVINDAGQIAFQSFLSGPQATQGIFAGFANALGAVARVGDSAPGGGSYGALADPSLNASGNVAFYANLTGNAVRRGLFFGNSGSVQPIARDGGAAPGGGTFSDFVSSVEINAAGQVGFIGNLTDDGHVTSANDVGLYAGTVGNLTKLVRTGDVIDVDPGPGLDNRTVQSIGFVNFAGSSNGSGGQDGRSLALNDSGVLIYQLVFTDSTNGVFTSAIPEPTSLLLPIATLLLLRQRRSIPRR